MIKRMVIMLVLFGIVAAGVVGFRTFVNGMIKKAIAGSFSAPVVSSIKADIQDWQPELKAVGNFRAIKGADLSTEVGGIVDEIHFDSGSEVEEGTLLVQLRSQDDLARLKALESSAKLAEINYARDEKQLKVQAVSQATADADAANVSVTKAQVLEQRAILEKKTVLAPFSGRVGVRAVDVGQYLSPGTVVVTLQQLDPIYLDFYLPQQALTQIKKGQKITATSDAVPDKVFEGEVTAINSKVETSTRNVLVRATIPNPDHSLMPGMFGSVAVASGDLQKLITVPQTAIAYNPYGSTVYIISDGGKDEKGEPKRMVNQSFVTTGDTRGDQVSVLTGLKEGDEVVTAGQVKLRNGMAVKINNEVQPSNDPNPKPEEK